jgi:Sulfotransferase domain
MKVIGAGLPRTATSTQLVVLEQLGFAECYHMRNVLMDLENELPKWERLAAGEGDWEKILGGFNSCCDFPTARYYRELADYYPDAKVLLSVRSADGWVRSMHETIWSLYNGDSVMHYTNSARMVVNPLWRRYIALMLPMTFAGDGPMVGADAASDEEFGAMMDRWNDEVRATIPAERLLVWDPADGWEPLCEFLEVPVPDGPVPRINDTAAFKEGIIGGALNDLAAWWDQRERPASGLHGAAIE